MHFADKKDLVCVRPKTEVKEGVLPLLSDTHETFCCKYRYGRLLYEIYQCFKGFWLFSSYLRKHFSVETYLLFFELSHKYAVAES